MMSAACGTSGGAETVLRRERALVAAALAAVAALAAALSRSPGGADADALRTALALGRVGHDTLLVATRADDAPRLVASLARDGIGDLRAATLALDPATIVLSTEAGDGPLDAVIARPGDAAAAEALRRRLAAAASALSILETRLDLQATFVSAILSDEADAPETPLPATLDAAAARDMALAVHAMLAGRPLAIAANNRRTLQSLFSAPGAAHPRSGGASILGTPGAGLGGA